MATSASAPLRESGEPIRETADGGCPDLPEGARLGRFRIEGPLDRFAGRCVYAARHVETGESVAIKLGRRRHRPDGQLETDEQVLARLRREAEVLRQLDPAAVPRVKALNEQPPYLVLERLEGVDLDHLLRSHTRIEARDIVALLSKVTEILTSIHLRGIVHCDVKPSNIFIRTEGGPLLVDFGAARRIADAGTDRAEDWSLTPEYAPPEFYRANAAIGPWSDVYSLGAVAYRLVTGQRPSPSEVRLRGAAMPSAIEVADPSYPHALAAAIDWALELEPTARPLSVEEWRSALHAAIEAQTDGDAPTVRVRRRMRPEVIAVDPPRPSPEIAARPLRRRPPLTFGAAAIVLATLAPLVVPVGQEVDIKQEWIVDPDGHGDSESIGAALARAGAGATIRVRPGTYAESVMVAQPVRILGIVEGDAGPVIAPSAGPCMVVTASARIAGIVLRGAKQGPGEESPCLDIAGGRVTAESIQVIGASGTGVIVRDGAELNLSDGIIAGSGGAGLGVAAGGRAALSRGEIREAGKSGVIARGGADLVLSHVRVADAREAGLLVAEGARARVENAAISASGTSGVEISGGAQGIVVNSVVERAAQAGVFVTDGGRVTLEATQVSNSGLSGLIVALGGNASAHAATFQDNGEHGVLILELAGGTIENNRMIGNAGHGIAIERGANGEVAGNTVERNREPQVLDARRGEPAAAERRRGGPS